MKSPLATEVFNLARYHIPPAKMSAKTQREVGKNKLMFKTALVESAILACFGHLYLYFHKTC